MAMIIEIGQQMKLLIRTERSEQDAMVIDITLQLAKASKTIIPNPIVGKISVGCCIIPLEKSGSKARNIRWKILATAVLIDTYSYPSNK